VHPPSSLLPVSPPRRVVRIWRLVLPNRDRTVDGQVHFIGHTHPIPVVHCGRVKGLVVQSLSHSCLLDATKRGAVDFDKCTALTRRDVQLVAAFGRECGAFLAQTPRSWTGAGHMATASAKICMAPHGLTHRRCASYRRQVGTLTN
jgi:hypothetical protein